MQDELRIPLMQRWYIVNGIKEDVATLYRVDNAEGTTFNIVYPHEIIGSIGNYITAVQELDFICYEINQISSTEMAFLQFSDAQYVFDNLPLEYTTYTPQQPSVEFADEDALPY